MSYDYSTDEAVLANRIIDILNECLAIDPNAIHNLIEFRTPTNQALADHPSVQVNAEGAVPVVGMLGILNGIVGVIPGSEIGYITAVFDDDQKLIRFELSKLEAYKTPA
jgi:hypothetical protein